MNKKNHWYAKFLGPCKQTKDAALVNTSIPLFSFRLQYKVECVEIAECDADVPSDSEHLAFQADDLHNATEVQTFASARGSTCCNVGGYLLFYCSCICQKHKMKVLITVARLCMQLK